MHARTHASWTQDIETGFQTSTERVTTKRHLEAERLVRTAYLVVKEHLPFTLQELNGLELGENYLFFFSHYCPLTSLQREIKCYFISRLIKVAYLPYLSGK